MKKTRMRKRKGQGSRREKEEMEKAHQRASQTDRRDDCRPGTGGGEEGEHGSNTA